MSIRSGTTGSASVEDGQQIVVENTQNKAVTKLAPVAGRDHDLKARFLRVTESGQLQVYDEKSKQEEILLELKKLNTYLSLVVGEELGEDDIIGDK